MANQNYDQLMELVATGKLNWSRDRILALLAEGASFDATDKKVSDLGVTISFSRNQVISGRMMLGRDALGAAVLFEDVLGDTPFQVLVVQDDGRGDPNLLAFIDTDETGADLSITEGGTLIVRPQAPAEVNPQGPPTSGVWLRF